MNTPRDSDESRRRLVIGPLAQGRQGGLGRQTVVVIAELAERIVESAKRHPHIKLGSRLIGARRRALYERMVPARQSASRSDQSNGRVGNSLLVVLPLEECF